MHKTRWIFFAGFLLLLLSGFSPGDAQEAFVNFESPQVHPMDLSPDGNTLAVVNTAANRLEIFDVRRGRPRLLGSVSVGLDPVSVRFRNNNVVWVVNHISDSLNVVNVKARRIMATVDTLDEPADVVFAGQPERAFVSCSQVNKLLVFDANRLGAPPVEIEIDGEEPRALATSPDRSTVYAAIFESGNGTTVLPGGGTINTLVSSAGPHGGRNPPPNSGNAFVPPIRSDLPAPPPVSLIVRKDGAGRWLDDNGGDWREFVSGSQAGSSGRPAGWDVADNDLAVIDANNLSLRYVRRLMNLVMGLAVHPTSGDVTAFGTDATNEIRWEPNLNGRFLRVNMALVRGAGLESNVLDLNPHLTYNQPRVSPPQRALSLGDPRAMVWSADGRRGYIAGMGSNNVVVMDRAGRRVGLPIEVGEGPTGLALDRFLDRLYVLNRFDASISVIDLGDRQEIDRTELFDPTPTAIRNGRRFLYDTHLTSGLGHVSCGSCHVDARLDRLAWDLGDPRGNMKAQNPVNRISPQETGFSSWHPMKGPKTTQTLQDIIGKEPFHWRGDRDGIEEFNGAFVSLLGNDRALTAVQMQQFENFLSTIHYPPNPFRNLDNSLSTNLPLPGHMRPGRFGRRGEPLPNGDAVNGMALFRSPQTPKQCILCHTLPVGKGSPRRLLDSGQYEVVPPGANGEEHTALQAQTATTVQRGMVVPQLRNLYERVGFSTIRRVSRVGFGFFSDGTGTSLEEFLSINELDPANDQEIADVLALMLSFSGSDFSFAGADPPGTPSLDAHAAVGRQVTIGAADQQGERIAMMIELADRGVVDLVVKVLRGAVERGWVYRRDSDRFAPDRHGQSALRLATLKQIATPRTKLTFTVVPLGSGTRIGIDRDLDGVLDFEDRD